MLKDNEVFEKGQTEVGYSISEAKLSGIVRKNGPSKLGAVRLQGSWKLGWTPFVEENYGSNPVLRRIFSLARKHGYRSLVIDEITESDCALLVQENKALAARRPDFLRSEVHRIAYFKSPQGHQPGPSDFVGYVVFKRDYFSTQAQPRVHVFESVTPPFRQGPVAGQQYLSELAPTGGEKLWGAGLNLPK